MSHKFGSISIKRVGDKTEVNQFTVSEKRWWPGTNTDRSCGHVSEERWATLKEDGRGGAANDRGGGPAKSLGPPKRVSDATRDTM